MCVDLLLSPPISSHLMVNGALFVPNDFQHYTLTFPATTLHCHNKNCKKPWLHPPLERSCLSASKWHLSSPCLHQCLEQSNGTLTSQRPWKFCITFSQCCIFSRSLQCTMLALHVMETAFIPPPWNSSAKPSPKVFGYNCLVPAVGRFCMVQHSPSCKNVHSARLVRLDFPGVGH